MNRKTTCCTFVLSCLVSFICAAAERAVDSALPDYRPVSGMSGNLTSVGSDTLANVMTLWAEEFRSLYKGVNIQVHAAGSSTAPPALSEGASDLGPMSRKMKDKELEAFEKRRGYKPTAVPVAIDALLVFVHKDNPLPGLSLPQVDAVFSRNRECGAPAAIDTWGGLGLTGQWEKERLQLYGRNSASGTYGYFKKVALCKGDFRANVNEQPGSASVVQSVGSTLSGIGYSGIGYVTSAVRALPLARRNGDALVAPSAENALSGAYPLSRLLYVYVNKPPTGAMRPLVAEFLRMILSADGQRLVEKDGYISLPAELALETLGQLELL